MSCLVVQVDLDAFFAAAEQAPGIEFTLMSPREIRLIHFRDTDTGKPYSSLQLMLCLRIFQARHMTSEQSLRRFLQTGEKTQMAKGAASA